MLDSSYIQKLISIENNVHVSPWSKQKFHSCFNVDLYQVIGLFNTRHLCGYAVVLICEPEVELQNFVIDKPLQSQGLGEVFLNELINHFRNIANDKITLEVRQSNSPAIKLYTRCGFKQVGLRKDYYQNNSKNENALLFTLEI